MLTSARYKVSITHPLGPGELTRWLVEAVRQLDQWEDRYTFRANSPVANQSLYESNVKVFVDSSPAMA